MKDSATATGDVVGAARAAGLYAEAHSTLLATGLTRTKRRATAREAKRLLAEDGQPQDSVKVASTTGTAAPAASTSGKVVNLTARHSAEAASVARSHAEGLDLEACHGP